MSLIPNFDGNMISQLQDISNTASTALYRPEWGIARPRLPCGPAPSCLRAPDGQSFRNQDAVNSAARQCGSSSELRQDKSFLQHEGRWTFRAAPRQPQSRRGVPLKLLRVSCR
ncbi:hypothetical protein FQA47_011524 [Oryzias melastigma]|uniref:Uncharacterized protein n=1 Tax=Oryzias melastigma TaxID=30732 RepID=A0A834CD02_ORYME|nr:hypothetical protein FQA47_011524 [Oryzias melastigma]